MLKNIKLLISGYATIVAVALQSASMVLALLFMMGIVSIKALVCTLLLIPVFSFIAALFDVIIYSDVSH